MKLIGYGKLINMILEEAIDGYIMLFPENAMPFPRLRSFQLRIRIPCPDKYIDLMQQKAESKERNAKILGDVTYHIMSLHTRNGYLTPNLISYIQLDIVY